MGWRSLLSMLNTSEKRITEHAEEKRTRAKMAVDCAPRPFFVLIDKSSSMGTTDIPPSRIEVAREATIHCVDFLYERSPASQVGIGTFADGFHECIPTTSVGEGYANIMGALRTNLGPDGNTDMDKGLRGIHHMTRDRTSDNHSPILIMLTDGNNTGPSDRDVVDTAQAMKQEGIDIWAIGIGHQADVAEDLLRQVVSKPDQYIFIANYEGPEAIIRTFEQIARAGLYLNDEEEDNDR